MAIEGADKPVVLSVIIACLNAARTLGAQLDALAGQSCPLPWELLICDNGSSDGTAELAQSYRNQLSNLRIIDASSVRGAGPARNQGVQQARGTWIAFCDADDVVAHDWLVTMIAALERCRFVAGRFEKYRLNDLRTLRSRPLQQQDDLQSTDIGARLPHAGGGNLGMRREDFLSLGGFDSQIRWLEDTDLSWRAQLAGICLTFCPEVVVHVRLRSTYRTMYAQGHQYGLAHALLEERYGSPEPRKTGVTSSAAAVRRPLLEALAGSLVDHVVGGRLFWRLGWGLGHRSHRPGSLGPVPRPLPSLVLPAPARAVDTPGAVASVAARAAETASDPKDSGKVSTGPNDFPLTS